MQQAAAYCTHTQSDPTSFSDSFLSFSFRSFCSCRAFLAFSSASKDSEGFPGAAGAPSVRGRLLASSGGTSSVPRFIIS
ncbi:hypothetical protein DUNSADRAFT_14785 [Dunaliella salina]|uniref:Encoded protein n=1 Tax=Dunaliella salina TaxID=3046 RepID=A0ABQ7G6T5_DUNSA|nr:hypothetical protein DUNSADRAFT_14785 [Dunaliella salina]|eukprot:KAF5830295.1 hypothetical protein DUNSADRAFT_14785 [Dunaliella salina]